MLKLFFTISLIILSFPTLSGPSGCVIESGKKRKFDPNCNCLKTGKCYSGKKIENLDEKLKSINGQSWTGDKNKELIKKSLEVRNEILELRSKGLARSRKARQKFQELDQLNKELEVLQKEDTARLKKKINDRKQRLGIKEKKKDQSYLIKLSNFIKAPFKSLSPNSIPSKKPKQAIAKSIEPSEIIEDVKPVITQKEPIPAIPSPKQASRDGLSKYDKEGILANLKQDKQDYPKDFITNDNDSIFKRVSKAYLRNAYEVLLSTERSTQD